MWHVALTSKGKKLVEKMDRPNLEMHSWLLGHLSKKKGRQLLEILEEAREGMRDYPRVRALQVRGRPWRFFRLCSPPEAESQDDCKVSF